jgi:hypothetical protein
MRPRVWKPAFGFDRSRSEEKLKGKIEPKFSVSRDTPSAQVTIFPGAVLKEFDKQNASILGSSARSLIHPSVVLAIVLLARSRLEAGATK